MHNINAQCPHCGTHLIASECLSHAGRQPQPGDVTLCTDCFEFFEFGPNLEGIKVTPERQKAMDEHPAIQVIKAMIPQLIAERAKQEKAIWN